MYHIYSSIQEQVFVFQMFMICRFRFQEVMGGGGGGVMAEISLVVADTCPSLKRFEVYFSYRETQSSSPLEIYRGFMNSYGEMNRELRISFIKLF